MKFVANHLVAIHNVATAEAMILAERAGLDPKLVVEMVGPGAGGSRMFQMRAPMMVEGKYEPATMKVSTWKKDMAIIAEFADDVGCETPLFTLTQPVYTQAMAMGLGDQDTAAVFEVLKRTILTAPKKGRGLRTATPKANRRTRRATLLHRVKNTPKPRFFDFSAWRNPQPEAWLSLDHLGLPSDKSLKKKSTVFGLIASGGIMTISRRQFVSGVAGAGIATMASPNLAFAQNSGTIRVGLLGDKTGPLASGGIDMERAC